MILNIVHGLIFYWKKWETCFQLYFDEATEIFCHDDLIGIENLPDCEISEHFWLGIFFIISFTIFYHFCGANLHNNVHTMSQKIQYMKLFKLGWFF